MIAVADTSPLCYLVLIGEIELLPLEFERVHVPRAVISELLHPQAPDLVRMWAEHLPRWIRVDEPPTLDPPELRKLQAGEREAILLASALSADLILLDEKPARRVALAMGLRTTGTLGLLADAALKRRVELPVMIERLKQTSFRCSPALLKGVLDRVGRGESGGD